MSEYVFNISTQKLELHFEKSEYMALSEESKREIKSNFLFSRIAGAWVSRAKFPNLYYAEKVAEKLGLKNGGKVGEALTFAEQMERKAERAENRAERYESRAEKSQNRGEQLQKPIDDMRGKVAFFTQPNVNTSAGRAFTNRREKMFAAYKKGFEEFKKSEYYAEKAETARQTAQSTKPTDKGFICRRIKDAEKAIKQQQENLERSQARLKQIESGAELRNYLGELITAEMVANSIEKTEMILDNEISKAVYYHQCLEELGGVEFSQSNIKSGDVIQVTKWGTCKVVRTGKVNATVQILVGGAAGSTFKVAYAEIEKIITAA